MFSVIVLHADEDVINKELIDNLEEYRSRGCELILLQDDRFSPPDFFKFDIVIKHSVSEGMDRHRNFANQHASFEWVLWLDFDEYLFSGFSERAIEYMKRDIYGYGFYRLNMVAPVEKTRWFVNNYGWYNMVGWISAVTIRGQSYQAINYPEVHYRFVRRDCGKWVGKRHEYWYSNDFHKKAIFPADRETLFHVKPIDKAIRDNYKWRTL